VKPQVLFVCVHNAGRSQMAAALLEHHGMGRVDVLSAGSEPGTEVNQMAVKALTEWGIDISDRKPKVLSDGAVRASDVVVTMGCGDACPVYPGKRYVDWDLTDPAGKGLDVVKGVRDDIDARVRHLLSELVD
jgi:arsenate reductase